MLSTYTYPRYAYQRPPELTAPEARHHARVVVVGAGPVGLAAAIELAQQGVAVTLLDEDDTVSIGSRGLCYAKRTLEVLDRLGVGDAIVAKGVTWNVGRTFHRDTEVFNFNLLPEADHERPGMVNLQQYWLEQYLVERALQLPSLQLRFKHQVTHLKSHDEGVALQVGTPDGNFTLHADWLVVADGARSPIRRMLGLDMEGQVFRDRFLIADVVMQTDLFPGGAAERWFWFDPPFHPGQSVLLHKEADKVWRIDFQLGWDADPEAEKQPERVLPRVQALLEHGLGLRGSEQAPAFELEWASVYTFQCRRMARLRHGRVLFAGDAAHQVSPFGARGANSGIQDADNLVWKLKLVLDGMAPESLLDSYSTERVAAADENLLNSTRSTDFITPKSTASRDLRNAVLTLAREHAFARTLVNSGRLSVPTHLVDSPLSTPDADAWDCTQAPGSPLADAPVRHEGRDSWLLRHTGGSFVLLVFVPTPDALGPAQRALIDTLAAGAVPVRTVLVAEREGHASALPAGVSLLHDHHRRAAQRLDASPGCAVLLRPDQHLAARWRGPTLAAVQAALARACARAG
ncbi:MAG: FAD-dependent oxidoreductase [Rubrivivax sp.]|nr:FAD-dependent oxidoreductase [Rubrivivax sp.]